MSVPVKEPSPVESDGLPVAFLPHLTENFETAEAQIKELYGLSPGIPALMRLWVACGTSWRIRREFERAVLDIKRKSINPNEEGEFDEDCI